MPTVLCLYNGYQVFTVCITDLLCKQRECLSDAPGLGDNVNRNSIEFQRNYATTLME